MVDARQKDVSSAYFFSSGVGCVTWLAQPVTISPITITLRQPVIVRIICHLARMLLLTSRLYISQYTNPGQGKTSSACIWSCRVVMRRLDY
jgi:hypothetical protein